MNLRSTGPLNKQKPCDSLQATLECEPPNANLHKFQGRLMYTSEGTGGRIRLPMAACGEAVGMQSCMHVTGA